MGEVVLPLLFLLNEVFEVRRDHDEGGLILVVEAPVACDTQQHYIVGVAQAWKTNEFDAAYRGKVCICLGEGLGRCILMT